MIDERVLAVAGVAVLILIAQGLIHLFLTAAGVYLSDRTPSEPDSSDERRTLLEYRSLLRERFHRLFAGDGGPPGDGPVPGSAPGDRPTAPGEQDARLTEARARAALVRDRPAPSRPGFQAGVLTRPALVLLIALSAVFNW
ncbi:hypothetical protein [Nocardiopsis tropica]|uniref:Uncharacterized protein n=1 Tax=Nocardiopsis tropica TaxID=109330 RepID=A0ABV1ZRV8_9ACTN|nr:hypothetical protein [Nocardiopsis tropica]